VIDLTVIVVNWNTRELILECLAALKGELEAGAHSWEVIVVDNGSGDGSVEAVREHCPWAAVIDLHENLGYARANNLALARAHGRVALLLNSDARLCPGAVARCVAVLDGEPAVGAVGLQLLHPDGRLQNSIHAFPLVPTVLLELCLPGRFPSKRYRHALPLDVDAVLGAAFFVRRATIEAVGPLSEAYFFFLEETDWCWRMRQAGWRVLHVPDARAVHQGGASSKRQHPLETRIEFHRSLYRFVRTRRGRASLAGVVVVRLGKGFGGLLLAALASPFSQRQRARVHERLGLLGWHLRGCPPDAGLRHLRGVGLRLGALPRAGSTRTPERGKLGAPCRFDRPQRPEGFDRPGPPDGSGRPEGPAGSDRTEGIERVGHRAGRERGSL
jgi:GT2 family glycosyltransferase